MALTLGRALSICSTLITYTLAQTSSSAAPTATIDSGPIIGRSTQTASTDTIVHQFLGIPFAQPPIDDLRFAPPQEPEPWTEPLNVTQQPNSCVQYLRHPGITRTISDALFNNPSAPSEDEDCLYLNVFVPEGGESEKPVLFWIHGGSGIMGSISLPLYDGTDFAANQDVIVVMSNYRLSIFGAPNAPQLNVEESSLALMDQRLALDWIQRNIAEFGGDPDKGGYFSLSLATNTDLYGVTVMGESAGAMAVGDFINTFPVDPPFRAGIEMSGSKIASAGTDPSIDSIEGIWPALMSLVNCTDPSSPSAELSCARSVPSRDLMSVLVDNDLRVASGIPDNITSLARPDIAWLEGNVAHVPLLIGSTAHDASFWVVAAVGELKALAAANNTEFIPPPFATVLEDVLNIPSTFSAFLAELYTPGGAFYSGPNDTVAQLTQLGTDYLFRCTSNFVANLTSSILKQPVWQYEFNATTPSTTFEEWPELGVWHASEIASVFGTYNTTGRATEVDVELSRVMQKRFGDFVRDPSANGGPGWGQWPEVGVIGSKADGWGVEEVHVDELAPICQLLDGVYLQELPALAEWAGGKGTGQGGEGGSGDGPGASSAAPSARGNWAVLVGGLALGTAALL